MESGKFAGALRRALLCGGVLAGALAAQRSVADDRLMLDGAFEVDNAAEIWTQEGLAWPRWNAHDDGSRAVVDHQPWADFLTAFTDPVNGRGAIDYVYVLQHGMGALARYLFAMQQVPVSTLSRDEQLAYWFNLHNARAVELTALSRKMVFDDSDTTRVLILGPRWREQSLEVEGERLSLVDIERRIVMRLWGSDPVVLYGLYLPALGRPRLPAVPFTGATVRASLDRAAREFVNSDRAIEFRDGRLHVSAIYFWDQQLMPDDRAILEHLRHYAAPALKARLAKFDTITASYLNWRIDSWNSGYDLHQDHQGGSCPL